MILRIVGVLLALFVLFNVAVMAASELGGEVVTLHTRGEDGTDHTTSLWIVEDEGAMWLRAGMPESGWLVRLQADPLVEVERGDRRLALRAVPVAAKRDRIHELMRRDYGWADVFVGTIPGRDPEASVAVRLDPR